MTGRLRNVDRRKNPALDAGRVSLFLRFFKIYPRAKQLALFFCLSRAESEGVFRSLFLPVEGKM